jgi:exopolysaccharide biosynthesis protein
MGAYEESKRRGVLVTILGLLALILTSLPAQAISASTETVSWLRVANGVEYTTLPFLAAGRQRGQLVVARMDPSSVLFRVAYHLGQRKTVQDWAIEMPSALLIVNASFSVAGRRLIGLVVINNKVASAATGRADSGEFQVEGEIPNIGPLTADRIAAIQASKQYLEAFEGYPLLIAGGKPMSSFTLYDAGVRARRTVVAEDAQGHILVIVTSPTGPTQMTMAEMVDWLQQSGLGIVSALNLDGGSSSQLYLGATDTPPELRQGYVGVPVVLVVYPR